MHEAFDKVSEWLQQQSLPRPVVFKMRVVAEEMMSNVSRHSTPKDPQTQAEVNITVDSSSITFILYDASEAFNPIENKDKGYGLTITNGIANDISYEYKDGRNITTIVIKY